MKKIIYSLLIISAFVSCTTLDENPLSYISEDSYYKTSDDAFSAVIALYSNLTHNNSGVTLGMSNSGFSYYNRMPTVTYGCASDNVTPGPSSPNPDYRAICGFTATSSNTNYTELWRQSYEIINKANVIIDRVPQISGDTALLNRFVREAKFIRALVYFNTVRLWGNIPLVIHETTSTENLEVAQSDTSAVYAQIKADLNDALLLPKRSSYTTADGFRASRGAARALLISVAITQRNWKEAVYQYNEIVNLGEYSLFDSYADNFSSSNSLKNTKEHIFDVYYIADGTSGGTGNTNLLGKSEAPKYGAPKYGNQTGSAVELPNVTLRTFFRNDDTRTRVTFVDTVYTSTAHKATTSATVYFDKWRDKINYSSSNLSNDGVNIPVIRYAELILAYAEAQNELGNTDEAYSAINRIRRRAFYSGGNITVTKPRDLTSGLTQDQIRDSIFLERRLEFAYEETVRWFDLVRLNGSGSYLIEKAIAKLYELAPSDSWAVAKYTAYTANPKKFLLFPIPYTEIEANQNLIQNYGWE